MSLIDINEANLGVIRLCGELRLSQGVNGRSSCDLEVSGGHLTDISIATLQTYSTFILVHALEMSLDYK